MFRSHCFCFCVFCAALGMLLLWMCLFSPPPAQAAPGDPVSFINDIAPILKENCFACHDSKKRKGKLDMTTYETLRKGGDKEDPIVVGKPEESYFVDLLEKKGTGRMPPKDSGEALPKDKIDLIKAWIKQGAKLDQGINVKADLLKELRIRFKPPTAPVVYPRPVTITALAFTPDNQHVVVGGNHELTVWSVTEGKLVKRIATRAERAYGMLFLPDGNLVVAGGRPGQEGDVKVYNLNGGTVKKEGEVELRDGVNDKGVLVAKLLEVDDSVNCIAATKDGKRLASGGCDRAVNVWDLSGGVVAAKLEQTIENHADWIFGVAFSPTSEHLLTSSRDKTAKVWDLKAKESVLTFPDHQNTVYGVAIKADGKVGISVGEDKQIRFWNSTGDPKQIAAVAGHNSGVFRLITHPTQALMYTCGGDNAVKIWNADSRAAVKTMTGHTDQVFALAVSPDGNLLASGSYNGEVKIWKATDGTPVKEFNGSPGYQPPPKK